MNHFLGPVQQHQAQDLALLHDLNAPAQNELPLKEDDELAGWGHWAMPAEHNELVDQELEAGEFLELADLLQPLDAPVVIPNLPDMDGNSELTISLSSNGIAVNE